MACSLWKTAIATAIYFHLVLVLSSLLPSGTSSFSCSAIFIFVTEKGLAYSSSPFSFPSCSVMAIGFVGNDGSLEAAVSVVFIFVDDGRFPRFIESRVHCHSSCRWYWLFCAPETDSDNSVTQERCNTEREFLVEGTRALIQSFVASFIPAPTK